MKSSCFAAVAAFGALASPSFAATLTVQDTLGAFNLVTESYSGTQEVEGRTYIGGTLDGVTGQFGFVDPGDGLGYAALSVAGDLVDSTINLTTTAQADVQGQSVNSVVNNGVVNEGATDLPMFDFASFAAEATYLAGLTGTAADVSDQNNKVFGGAAIVDVDLADLASGSYSFDLAGLDSVIINVSGTTGSFGMNPVGATKSQAPNVLWNFWEATDVTVNSVIAGHVLAPNATMRGFNGSTEGTVIASSVFLTNGELHQNGWTGDVPVQPSVAAVPLPAGLPMLFGGVLALFALRSRRATAAA